MRTIQRNLPECKLEHRYQRKDVHEVVFGAPLLVTSKPGVSAKHFDLDPRSECCLHPIDLVCFEMLNHKLPIRSCCPVATNLLVFDWLVKYIIALAGY